MSCNPFRDRIDAQQQNFADAFKQAFLWGSTVFPDEEDGDIIDGLEAYELTDDANALLDAMALIIWRECGCYLLPYGIEDDENPFPERDQELAEYAGHTAALTAMGHGISFEDRDISEWFNFTREHVDKRARAIAGALEHSGVFITDTGEVEIG